MNKQTVRDALDRLRAQGEVYIKADDVAKTVGKEDPTSGEKSHISSLLGQIEGVEKWGRSRSVTWQITDGEGV